MSKGIVEILGLEYVLLPKFLYTDKRFKHLTGDAKVVYSMMLSLLDRSEENGWTDENGRQYVQLAAQEIQDFLGCPADRVTRIYKSLEEAGLIVRKRRPCEIAKIYICNIFE